MSIASPRLATALFLLATATVSLTGCSTGSSGPPDDATGLGLGGCTTDFPDVVLVGSPPDTVHVGDEISLTARVRPDAQVQIVRLQFVVAVPGTEPEASSDQTPAEQPANQLAVSTVPPPGVAGAQEPTLTWTPQSTGTFPVIYVEYAVGNEDCSTPPPDETDPAKAGQSESELATITVE